MRAVCALTHTRAPVGEFDVSRRVFEREGGGPKDGCDALYVLRGVATKGRGQRDKGEGGDSARFLIRTCPRLVSGPGSNSKGRRLLTTGSALFLTNAP